MLKGFLSGAINPEKNKDMSGLGSKQKLKNAQIVVSGKFSNNAVIKMRSLTNGNFKKT